MQWKCKLIKPLGKAHDGLSVATRCAHLLVSLNRTASFLPEKVFVNLLRSDKEFQLLQANKSPGLEDFRRHVDPLKQCKKLLCPPPGVPLALELREMPSNFLKGNPVTTIVRARWAERDAAAGKNLCYNLGDLPHPIVMSSVADVEDLVVNRVARRLQDGNDSPADVQPVNQRTPRCAVTGHLYFLGCPGKTGEVVQYDVEAHSRRCSVSRRVPHKGGREMIGRKRLYVPFNESLAFGICRLGAHGRFLINEIAVGDAVNAARRHIHKAAYAGVACDFGQANRSLVVDLIGNMRSELTRRVVG